LWKGVVAYDVVGLTHYAKTWQIWLHPWLGL
jgi:hypothetical protein